MIPDTPAKALGAGIGCLNTEKNTPVIMPTANAVIICSISLAILILVGY